MKTSLKNSLMGVIVGIFVGLLITYMWGASWYQFAIAAIVATVVGVAVANHKSSRVIIVAFCQVIYWKLKALKIPIELSINKLSMIKVMVRLYAVLSSSLLLWLAFVLLLNHRSDPLNAATIVRVIAWLLCGILLLEPLNWKWSWNMLNDHQMQKLWAVDVHCYDHPLDVMCKNFTFGQTINRLFFTLLLMQRTMILGIVKIILLAIPTFIGLGIAGIVFPFWFLWKMSGFHRIPAVIISILVGVWIGTYFVPGHPDFYLRLLYGLGSGLTVFFLTIAISYAKKIDPLFFFRTKIVQNLYFPTT